jgi:hypothetical protein
MKDTSSIAVIAAVAAVAGFRLYQRYKQNKGGFQPGKKVKSTTFSSSSKEEEYEPYSKK